MKNSAIGVIDSGIGGASILKEILNVLPNEKFIYLADTLNAPYGNKSRQDIEKIVFKNVNYLLAKYHIKALVIACNTATSVCAKKLRQELAIPVICVEPPIKPAIESNYNKILILATAQTLKSNLTIKSNIKLAKGKKIKKLAIRNLATLIDQNLEHTNNLQSLLNRKLAKFINYDAVVIGCTHYNFIKKEIATCMPKATIISCEKPVAKQTILVLEKNNLLRTKTQKSKNIKIELTKQNKRLSLFLKKYLQ